MAWFRRLVPKNNHDEYALLHHASSNNLFIASRQVEIDGEDRRLFAAFNNHHVFIKYYLEISDDERCLYELIPGNMRMKPYFDIDIQTDDVCFGNSVIMSLFDQIISVWNMVKKEDIIIYESHGNGKMSFHVIINNYYVVDSNHCKSFYYKTTDGMKEEYKKYIDLNVYGKNQQFRMYLSHKIHTNRMKRISNLSVHDRVECEDDGNKTILMDLLDSFVTYTSNCELIHVDVNDVTRKNSTWNEEDIDVDDEDMKNAYDLLLSRFGDDFRIRISSNNGFHLLRNYPSMCMVCDRVHDSENSYAYVKDGIVYYKCFRSDGGVLLGTTQGISILSSIDDPSTPLLTSTSLPSSIDSPVPKIEQINCPPKRRKKTKEESKLMDKINEMMSLSR